MTCSIHKKSIHTAFIWLITRHIFVLTLHVYFLPNHSLTVAYSFSYIFSSVVSQGYLDQGWIYWGGVGVRTPPSPDQGGAGGGGAIFHDKAKNY